MRLRTLILSSMLAFCALTQSCSSASWARTKAHVAETGIAFVGGAIAAALMVAGSPIIAIAMLPVSMSVAAYTGEIERPPNDVTVVHEKTDKDGKVTTDVKTFRPKHDGDAPPSDTPHGLVAITTSIVESFWHWLLVKALWIGVAWCGIKLAFGPRYREHTLGWIKAFLTFHWISAAVSFWKAGGAAHTDKPEAQKP